MFKSGSSHQRCGFHAPPGPPFAWRIEKRLSLVLFSSQQRPHSVPRSRQLHVYNCHRNPRFLSGSQAVDLQDNSQPSFLSFFGPLPLTLTLSSSAALAITPLLLPPRGRRPRYCRHRDSLHHVCRVLLTSPLSPHSLRLLWPLPVSHQRRLGTAGRRLRPSPLTARRLWSHHRGLHRPRRH